MTDDNVLRIDGSRPGDNIFMMKTPDLWPHGVFLPLMHSREKDPDAPMFGLAGIMISAPGFPRTRVWLINMFDVRRYALLAGAEVDVPYRDYPCIEAIAADGWEVN